MKFKRLPILLAMLLALSTFFSSFALAEETSKPNLVALGDSITFGWNLDGPENKTPSQKAFPYLIWEGAFNVTNISGGGWTSAYLKNEIMKPANLEAIKNADVITLDIGNNDFLQNDAIKALIADPTKPVDPVAFGKLINGISTEMFANIGQIITVVKAQNPDVDLIIYNIYNPFSGPLGGLYPLGEQFLPMVNPGFQQIALTANAFLADAYSAFKGNQADYLRPGGDVHPNELGQSVLAGLASDILDTLYPPEVVTWDFSLSQSPVEETKGPVTITVTPDVDDNYVMAWLPGEKTVEDFLVEGLEPNIIENNQFEVTENGFYSVAVVKIGDLPNIDAADAIKLAASEEEDASLDEWIKVKTIEIKNIVKEDPKPTPDPGDDGNVTPPPAPGDNGQTPAPKPTTDKPAPNPNTGNKLPNTATAMFNYLAAGIVLILIGSAAMAIQYRRKQTV